MAVSEARRNHDELFPGRISTLAQADPELIECFDNFAFDEVLADSWPSQPAPVSRPPAAVAAPSCRFCGI